MWVPASNQLGLSRCSGPSIQAYAAEYRNRHSYIGTHFLHVAAFTSSAALIIRHLPGLLASLSLQ